MKKKGLENLRNLDLPALEKEIAKMKKELVKIKIDLGAGKIKSPQVVWQKRRDLAQAKTIAREKKEATK